MSGSAIVFSAAVCSAAASAGISAVSSLTAKDRATELFREDVSVYQLHADGSETLVEDRAALQEHDGLFG